MNKMSPYSSESCFKIQVWLDANPKCKLDPMFTPDVSLEDGHSLEANGIPAKIIGLLGHTQNSICMNRPRTPRTTWA